ncbi:MAG: hypothetical protein DRO15_00235 [Thermoprotei archaeon]|nr:MAG: hypothetical protein DRO15_00235 [Thermoprotei archaeon]
MPNPIINYYDFGIVVISGKEYRHDVIITPSRIISDWWRLEGHRLQLPDVRDYVLEDVDSVVIGTGFNGLMKVDEEVINTFRNRGVEIYIDKTSRAVDKYNELVKKGKKVLAFLHLTC